MFSKNTQKHWQQRPLSVGVFWWPFFSSFSAVSKVPNTLWSKGTQPLVFMAKRQFWGHFSNFSTSLQFKRTGEKETGGSADRDSVCSWLASFIRKSTWLSADKHIRNWCQWRWQQSGLLRVLLEYLQHETYTVWFNRFQFLLTASFKIDQLTINS